MTGQLGLLKQVRFVVFDFDGVLTDNRVLVGDDGGEYVFCSRADSLGLEALARAGIGLMILSTEAHPVVSARAAKLKIECVQGLGRKWIELQRILVDRGIPIESVAYVGNDVNDSECLRNVGVPICVADAHPDVRPLAKLITSERGGRGAVREICDLVVLAQQAG